MYSSSVRMDAFTERKVYEQMQKQHPPTEDTIGTELFADDIGSLISGRHLYLEIESTLFLHVEWLSSSVGNKSS